MTSKDTLTVILYFFRLQIPFYHHHGPYTKLDSVSKSVLRFFDCFFVGLIIDFEVFK